MKPQGRTQRALLGASFTYGQFAIGIAAAFFVTPLILRTLGPRQYGIWLSSGEIIGYLLLLDFGVFSILPWLIARADGQKQPGEIKRVLAHSTIVAFGLAAAILLIVFALWGTFPALLHLSAEEWHALAGPLALLVILLTINLPLNLFTSLLAGLQDVGFSGPVNLLKALLVPALTAGLLLAGYRWYALALGSALIMPIIGAAAVLRVRQIAPQLLREWPLPSLAGVARLFRESVGAWLGGAGIQMMERSNAVVLAFMGAPALIPVLVCSSRVGQILTQMTWVMPDSALVGFAQLGGENNPPRLREVALSIIRLNLVFAGGAACLVLALNPAFVRIWVGEKFFGGLLLNLLLAAEVISGSLNHALASIVAVHGNRLSIGLATLLQGAIYLVLALYLARRFSLEGLLGADLLAPIFSTLPISLWRLRTSIGLGIRQLASELGSLLLLRAGPCLLLAWLYGCWRSTNASLWELGAVGLLLSFVYLQLMAPRLATFPLPSGAKIWLQRLRII